MRRCRPAYRYCGDGGLVLVIVTVAAMYVSVAVIIVPVVNELLPISLPVTLMLAVVLRIAMTVVILRDGVADVDAAIVPNVIVLIAAGIKEQRPDHGTGSSAVKCGALRKCGRARTNR